MKKKKHILAVVAAAAVVTRYEEKDGAWEVEFLVNGNPYRLVVKTRISLWTPEEKAAEAMLHFTYRLSVMDAPSWLASGDIGAEQIVPVLQELRDKRNHVQQREDEKAFDRLKDDVARATKGKETL